MAFTTVVFSESQDLGGEWGNVSAVNDQHIKTQGDSVYVNQFNKYMGAMACIGSTGTGCRIVSPSIRRFAPIYVVPFISAIFPNPSILHTISLQSYVDLDIDEQLEVEINANPASAERESVAVWLADKEITPVSGKIYTIKAHVTGALTGGAWNFFDLNFMDDLAVGTYQVVGMNVVCAGGVVARLVPIGGTYRPGVPCSLTNSFETSDSIFRFGRLGEFCTFPHNNVPGLEIFASSDIISTTYNIYLDMIKK
jgi:hypothetical protein